MDPRHIAALIEAGETDLVEFKREWWDLDLKLGKGQFVRNVLAMANVVTAAEPGFIIIGVEDRKHAGFQIDSPPPFQNHSPPCSPACVTG